MGLFFGKEFFKSLFIFSPVLMNLHTKCEEYFFIEDIFENHTRASSDGFYLFSTFSDDDSFLRVGFDIYISLDTEHLTEKSFFCWTTSFEGFLHDGPCFAFLDLSDFYIRSIRDLISEFKKEDLTNHFLNPQIHRLISIVLRIIKKWAFWKVFRYFFYKFIETDLCNRVYPEIDSFLRITFCIHVLLGFDPEDWFCLKTQYLIDSLILDTIWTSWIKKTDDHICFSERGKCFRINSLIDFEGFLASKLPITRRIMDSRSIEKDDLYCVFFICKNTRDASLSCLRSIRNG